MRIIAGRLGGRSISAPKSAKTRPASQKLRGAIFDTLGEISGFKVLDAYAGSGALGFEALSRGARSVVAVEPAKAAQTVIEKNKLILGENNFDLQKTTVEAWLSKHDGSKFDLILADPPYASLDEQVLEQLAKVLNRTGTMVCSHSSKIELSDIISLKLVKRKNYGNSAISIYNLESLGVLS